MNERAKELVAKLNNLALELDKELEGFYALLLVFEDATHEVYPIGRELFVHAQGKVYDDTTRH